VWSGTTKTFTADDLAGFNTTTVEVQATIAQSGETDTFTASLDFANDLCPVTIPANFLNVQMTPNCSADPPTVTLDFSGSTADVGGSDVELEFFASDGSKMGDTVIVAAADWPSATETFSDDDLALYDTPDIHVTATVSDTGDQATVVVPVGFGDQTCCVMPRNSGKIMAKEKAMMLLDMVNVSRNALGHNPLVWDDAIYDRAVYQQQWNYDNRAEWGTDVNGTYVDFVTGNPRTYNNFYGDGDAHRDYIDNHSTNGTRSGIDQGSDHVNSSATTGTVTTAIFPASDSCEDSVQEAFNNWQGSESHWDILTHPEFTHAAFSIIAPYDDHPGMTPNGIFFGRGWGMVTKLV